MFVQARAHRGACSTNSVVSVARTQPCRLTMLMRPCSSISPIGLSVCDVDTLPGYAYRGEVGARKGRPAERRKLRDEVRDKVLARLKKVAGQVAGIQRMVEADRYCVDVLHQIAAVEGALDRVGHMVLAAHVETCVTSAIESGAPNERREKLDELLEVFSRFGRMRP